MAQVGPSPPAPAIWLCGLLGPVIFLCSVSLGAKIKNWEIPHKIKSVCILFRSQHTREPLGLHNRMAVAWQCL